MSRSGQFRGRFGRWNRERRIVWPGTWNIVGGDGGGAALEPDAGGFWFNKRQFEAIVERGTRIGNAHQRGVPVHGSNFASESRSSDFGHLEYCWRQEEGAPLDPNAAGFGSTKKIPRNPDRNARGLSGKRSR